MPKRVKVQVRRQSYLYAVKHNTNLSLQVVHSFGLTVLPIVLHEDVIHGALQVSAYLDRHKEKKQCS